MIEVRPFKMEDCFSVAQAHVKYLNSPFKGNGGVQLLGVYYEVIASQIGGIGFVAYEDLSFAGYVCGIWDGIAIKRALLKKWDRMIIHGIRQSLRVPKIVPDLLLRVINPKAMYLKAEGYELRPIVVLPDYRSRGIADSLVLRLVEDAKQRGFAEIFLLVAIEHVAAVKFYSRFGFTCERQIRIAGNAANLLRYSFSATNL